MSSEVVVTGLGLWTPYGQGKAAFWNGLISGKAALTRLNRFNSDRKEYRTNLAASIPNMGTDAESELQASRIIEEVLSDAIADAGVDAAEVPPYEVALILGITQGVPPQIRTASAYPAASPICSYGTASVLTWMAERISARGYVSSISTACASGTQSIGTGYRLIQRGHARRAFVGGFSSFSELSFSGFNILRLLSRSGCRPFDTQRDGVTLGDAFVLFVLEEEKLAQCRGARIYGRMLGYASGNEAFHATSPDPTGRAACDIMARCLQKQDQLERLDYINAHGTGTVANDIAELAAIAQLASRRRSRDPIAVNSTKGHHGHALGAAGSIEFAATLLTLVQQIVPPTCGLTEPAIIHDEIHLVHGGPCKRPIRVALSNSFAFGGNLASIAVGAA